MGFALKADLLGRAKESVPSGGEIPPNPDVVEFCHSPPIWRPCGNWALSLCSPGSLFPAWDPRRALAIEQCASFAYR